MVAKQNTAKKEQAKSKTIQSPEIRVVHTISSKNNPTKLDRLIHEKIRLGIVSALAVNESLSFNELKKILDTSDGNLSVHARKLEEAKYIECKKTFEGRMPKTEYRLTNDGKKAFERYLTHMESLIQVMKKHNG
jgi:DNA-binding HxlR family transcriptional regulator